MTGVQAGQATPTPAEVQAIAAMDDGVLRNLRITDCYSRLSASFATLTGPGANWCTFGVWASRQAGATIRGEDFALAIDDSLTDPEQGQRRFGGLGTQAQARCGRALVPIANAVSPPAPEPSTSRSQSVPAGVIPGPAAA